MKRTMLFIAICALLSCSKSGSNGDNPEGGFGLNGKLLYTFSGNVYQIDLRTGIRSTYFTYNTYSFSNWDYGLDGKYRLTSEREAGVYTLTKFKLLNAGDGVIVREFDYDSPNGTGTGYTGHLSPDNTKILIAADLDNGVVILDTAGNLIKHLEGINSTALTLGDEALWLPDNSLLLTLDDRYIFRSPPPYTSLQLVKEMGQTSWGNLKVDRAGTKITMQINGHIHMMNIDGSNLIQVTDSDNTENQAVFSPDGKHLMVGSNYRNSGAGYATWEMKIIPNDGKQYHLDRDPGVITVQAVNENIPAWVSGRNFWVP